MCKFFPCQPYLQALLNTVVDCTKMYRSQVASANCPPFTLPSSLAQLPLFVLSLLKNVSSCVLDSGICT